MKAVVFEPPTPSRRPRIRRLFRLFRFLASSSWDSRCFSLTCTVCRVAEWSCTESSASPTQLSFFHLILDLVIVFSHKTHLQLQGVDLGHKGRLADGDCLHQSREVSLFGKAWCSICSLCRHVGYSSHMVGRSGGFSGRFGGLSESDLIPAPCQHLPELLEGPAGRIIRAQDVYTG